MCLGIPGQIVEITDIDNRLGKVEIAGIRRQINLVCVTDEEHPIESCLGDWVLVHAGFAMSRINEEEAGKTLALLAALGEAQKDPDAERIDSKA
jgi:hydrogenase expression/formation protein HypC